MNRGFTIVEFLIVVVIIGVLLSGWALQSRKLQNHSQDLIQKQQILLVRQALNHFYQKNFKYPQNIDDLVKEGFLSEKPSFLFSFKKDSAGGIQDVEQGRK